MGRGNSREAARAWAALRAVLAAVWDFRGAAAALVAPPPPPSLLLPLPVSLLYNHSLPP